MATVTGPGVHKQLWRLSGAKPSLVEPNACTHEFQRDTGKQARGIKTVLWEGFDVGFVAAPIYRCVECGMLSLRIEMLQSDAQEVLNKLIIGGK